jgi:integrase
LTVLCVVFKNTVNMPLTDLNCRTAALSDKPKKFADQAGLYLLVNRAGKYWRWDYRHLGKRKTMAFGTYPEVTLVNARKKIAEQRQALQEGQDPMSTRKIAKFAAVAASGNSFEEVARSWHKAKSKKWAKVTADKTMGHMQADLFPVIGGHPITLIGAPILLAALRKVENRGAAYTATRLREICGQVFRYAIATGLGLHNPAGDLKGAIETPSVVHRPAITDPKELQSFLGDLRDWDAADQLTLSATKLALLTFVRSQELRFARWEEVDFARREWRIPAERMKTGKGLRQAHIVPLSKEAVAEFQYIKDDSFGTQNIFPNVQGGDKCMSENTIGRLLVRMGYGEKQTLHGFRATARTLLSERGWSEAALERQLDHKENDMVKAAYARSKHLSERRQIMDDWGRVVSSLEKGEGMPPLPTQTVP